MAVEGKAMPAKGSLKEFLQKAEQHPARWLLVAAGVALLLWMKLVLFAAALPLMAYWHYSFQGEDSQEADPEPTQGTEADGDADAGWPSDDDEGDVDENLPPEGRDLDTAVGLEKDSDPYDRSFWSGDGPAAKKAAAPAPKADKPDMPLPRRDDVGQPWRKSPLPSKQTSGMDDGDLDGTDPLGLDSLGLDKPARDELPPLASKSPAAAPWESDGGLGRDFDFGLGSSLSKGLDGGDRGAPTSSLPSMGGGGGFGSKPSAGKDIMDPFEGLGLGDDLPGSGLGDDFLGLGGDDDLFGSPSKGKGKGKGKPKGDKGGGFRDPMAPREPNPKQVFVANVGGLAEEEIRSFFEEVGEVDRLKVLRNPDGTSKGVCFVTFRTEEQAQKALALHGTLLDGRNLVVRLAHGGNKGGEKGDKGGGKGFGGDRDRMGDRPFGGDRMGGDRDGGFPDLGGSERFGAAFDGDRDRDRPFGGGDRGGFGGDRFGGDRMGGDRGGFGGDRGGFGGDRGGFGSDRFGGGDRGGFGDRGGGFGGGKGGRGGGKGSGKRSDRGEMDDLLEEALAEGDGPIKAGDFDFAARRFLSELRSRDRTAGTDRFHEAIDMVLKYTSSKDRSSVRKWPAYIFTLLQKFDPNLWEELRERDAERRREKGRP